MAWHNGNYPTVSSLTDADIMLVAQGGSTAVAILSTLKSYLGITSSGLLSSDSTLAGTPASLTETTLFSYTLPAATLSSDGWFVHLIAWGKTGINANNKTLNLYFGATAILGSGSAALNYNQWILESYIIRTAAGNQDAISEVRCKSFPGSWGTAATGISAFSEPAQNLNGAVTIAIKGQNGFASASDVTYEGSIILLNS